MRSEAAAGVEAHALYGSDLIHERHRPRYEFNCLYEKALTERASDRRPLARRQVRQIIGCHRTV
jgi:CTP synthase (UTP-ammonia lyase)